MPPCAARLLTFSRPTILTLSAAALAASATHSRGDLLDIGVNFQGRDSGGGTGSFSLAPTDMAGVIPQQNFNNIVFAPSGGFSTFNSGVLQDSMGDTSAGVTLTVSANDSWNSDTVNTQGPDYTLEKGTIKAQNAGNHITLTLSGLTANATYSFLTYNQENGGDSHDHATLVGATTYSNYYFVESNQFDGSYTQASSTVAGTYTPAVDYVRWDGVMADATGSLTMQLYFDSGGNDGAGLAGFQLAETAVPPPVLSKYYSAGPGAGAFDENTTTSFRTTDDAGASNAKFVDGDTATFGNLNGNGARTVSVSGNLQPAGVIVDNNANNPYTFTGTGTIGGASTLTKMGAGDLTINNTNTYTGITKINGGTLTPGVSGALGTGQIFFGGGILKYAATNQTDYSSRFSAAANQAISVDTNGEAVTFASPFGSNGTSFAKLGAGTLTLSADNNYTGGTSVSGGTVAAGGGGLGEGALNVADGATVTVSGRSGLAGRFFGDAPQNQRNYGSYLTALAHLDSNGNPALESTSPTLNFGTTDAAYYSVAGVPGTQAGKPTTFPGQYAGTLAVNFEAAYSGLLNVTTGGTYNFTLNSDDGSDLFIDGAAVVLNNFDQGTNAGGLQRQGSVALAPGYHTIVVPVNQGIGGYGLVAQVSGPNDGGAFYDLADGQSGLGLTPDLIVGSLSGAGNVVLATGGLIAGQDGSNTTFSGILSGVGGLEKAGSGTLALTGANTFAGTTTVGAGAVQVGNVNALQNSTVGPLLNDGVTFASGITAATFGGLAGSGNLTLQNADSNSVALTVGVNNASTNYAGGLNGAGSLTKIGSGTLTMSGGSLYTGGTTIQSGTVAVTNSLGLGSGGVTLRNGGTLSLSLPSTPVTVTDFNNNVLNQGPVLSNNNTVATLTDSNNNEARSLFTSAPVAINGAFTASFVYQQATNANAGADGLTFTVQTASPTAVGASGGGLGYQGIANSAAFAINVYNGHAIGTAYSTGGTTPGTYVASSPVNPASGDPISVTLTYDPVAQTLTEHLVDQTTNDLYDNTFTGVDLTGAVGRGSAYLGFTGGTGGLNATQVVSGFSYQETQTPALANALTVDAGAISTLALTGGATNTATLTGGLTLGTGATLKVIGDPSATDTAFSATETGTTVINGTSAFNIANNGAGTGALTVGAVIEGAAGSGLTKTGAGRLTINGSGNYTGPTNVTGGTLAASALGALGATPAINVSHGGNLLLTGSNFAPAAANVTLGASGTPGTLAFDNGNFSQTFTSLALNANSTLDFGTGTSATFSFTSTSNLTPSLALNGFALTVDHYTGAGTSDLLLTNTVLSDAQLGAVSFYNDNHQLLVTGAHEVSFAGPSGTAYEIVPIPEPSAGCGALLSLSLLGLRPLRPFRKFILSDPIV